MYIQQSNYIFAFLDLLKAVSVFSIVTDSWFNACKTSKS